MKVQSIQELFVEELRDVYDAEKQLVRALPKMAKSASDSELETAFREHAEQTKKQVQRIEQIFEALDEKPRSKPCHGMKGLVEEGREVMEEDMDEGIQASAVASAARKVEHYEMMAYESLRTLARQMKNTEALQLLEQNFREEVETDRRLATIGKRLVKEAGSGRAEMSASEGRSRSSSRSSRSSASSRSSSRQQSSSRGKSSSRSGSSSRGKSNGRGGAVVTTDHEEIRQWAEERGAVPSCVRGTGGKGDTGMIRLDFPGYTGKDSLQEISWDDWFEAFDENNLALLRQESTARGQKSNFNKLIKREGAGKPRAKAAR